MCLSAKTETTEAGEEKVKISSNPNQLFKDSMSHCYRHEIVVSCVDPMTGVIFKTFLYHVLIQQPIFDYAVGWGITFPYSTNFSFIIYSYSVYNFMS